MKEKRKNGKRHDKIAENHEKNIPIRKITTPNQIEDMFLDALKQYL